MRRSRATAGPLLIGGGIGVGGFGVGILLAWIALPLAALAASPDAPAGGTTVPITVYGDDPCPKGEGGAIVVCARRPENERYRLPKRFRGDKAKSSPAANAWSNKVQTLEQASRVGAGLPDTCSAVGSGGQSGCYHQFLQQSRAQRDLDQNEAGGVP